MEMTLEKTKEYWLELVKKEVYAKANANGMLSHQQIRAIYHKISKMMLSDYTSKISNYIKEHKELQVDLVTVKDMQDCAKECNCNMEHVMQVLRFGKVLWLYQ